MQLFYTTEINGDIASLSTEEARHCVQVLRKKVGDSLNLVDGQGFFYQGDIIETGKKTCLIKITDRKEAPDTKPLLKIAIAPPKNIDRLEWFLEKATEVGISEIIPILCQRSERKRIRLDRLEKIVLSAMKQSLKARLPKLSDLMTFNELMEHEQHTDRRFIAYCNDDNLDHLNSSLEKTQSSIILIGPEGDFSEDEIKLAKSKGFTGISLGKSRLRTETAGLVACTIFNLINETP